VHGYVCSYVCAHKLCIHICITDFNLMLSCFFKHGHALWGTAHVHRYTQPYSPSRVNHHVSVCCAYMYMQKCCHRLRKFFQDASLYSYLNSLFWYWHLCDPHNNFAVLHAIKVFWISIDWHSWSHICYGMDARFWGVPRSITAGVHASCVYRVCVFKCTCVHCYIM